MLDIKLLGRNIKELRRERGLTQTTFAEALHVSFQAVSNWERGIVPPDIDNLVNIAAFFNVMIDDLVQKKAGRLILGIDGGGTKTDVAVCDSEGNVIYRKKSSGCNPSNIGLENTVKLLQTALTEAYAGAGICQKKDETFVFIGAAGCGVGNNAAVVRSALQETAANVWVDSDIVNVIQTGLQGENGIAVIAGTGSLIAAYKDGAVFKFGGNGFLFEDSQG